MIFICHSKEMSDILDLLNFQLTILVQKFFSLVLNTVFESIKSPLSQLVTLFRNFPFKIFVES